MPKHAKNISKKTWKLFYGKNGWKKQLIVEKWDCFEHCKKWPQCKSYSLCKTFSLGQKKNCLKHAKNISTNTLKLVYIQNGWKKQLIFEKWDHFENCKKLPQCKGYSPCKTLSLGQKIKLPETCQKHLYKHIKVVLCKKRLETTANSRKMRLFWTLQKMATMQKL